MDKELQESKERKIRAVFVGLMRGFSKPESELFCPEISGHESVLSLSLSLIMMFPILLSLESSVSIKKISQ